MARSPKSISIVPALAGALLAFSFYQTSTVIRQAPAFAEGLRTEGIAGGKRTQDTTAMYAYSDYLFQTAAGFVNADAYSFATIEAPNEIASFDVVLDRQTRAADLLSLALTHDPANAYIWLVFAQALGATGRIEQALSALARSQDLSPTMPRLAYQRSWIFWALLEMASDSEIESKVVDQYRRRYEADRSLALEWPDAKELPPGK